MLVVGVARCLRLGRGRARGGVRPLSANDIGGIRGIKRETLMAVCQVAGISAAALILPCSLSI